MTTDFSFPCFLCAANRVCWSQDYYYNSFTDEAVWERPAELGAVVKAMRRWYGASGAAVRRTQDRRRGTRVRSTSPGSARSRSRSPGRGTAGGRRVTHREGGTGAVRAHSPRRDAYRNSPSRR